MLKNSYKHNSCSQTTANQADFFSCNANSIILKGTIIIVLFLLVVIILIS